MNDRLLQSPGRQLQSPQRGGRCKGVKMLLGSQQLPEGKTMAFRGNTEQHLIQSPRHEILISSLGTHLA